MTGNRSSAGSADTPDGPCFYCGEMTSSYAGDPGRWPLRFCQRDGTGITRYHHTRCVTDRLNHPAQAALNPPPLEAIAAELGVSSPHDMRSWAAFHGAFRKCLAAQPPAAPVTDGSVQEGDVLSYTMTDGVGKITAHVRPPAAPVETEELLSRLVDWTYLHALEGAAWPSTKTKQMLIARARQDKPTQDHADGMKAMAPVSPSSAGNGAALTERLIQTAVDYESGRCGKREMAEARAAVEAAITAAPQPTWQPIETAPKGPTISVARKGGQRDDGSTYWYQAVGHYDPNLGHFHKQYGELYGEPEVWARYPENPERCTLSRPHQSTGKT